MIDGKFFGSERVSLILRDNIFYRHGPAERLERTSSQKVGTTVFGYRISDLERSRPRRPGRTRPLLSIDQKPESAHSHYTVTGLYFYDNRVLDRAAASITLYERGELEVTGVTLESLDRSQLRVASLGRAQSGSTPEPTSRFRSRRIETLKLPQRLIDRLPGGDHYQRGRAA